ncbi:MAG: cardiolipin synthase [Phycisphaerales bacterium]|nr:cardiolipin synthase [Phycisphaerales bacterium]
MPQWSGLITTLLVLDGLARAGLAVRVIMRRRPVPVTLAWLVLLFYLPVASLVAYIMIGEVRLGERKGRRFAERTRRIEQQAVALWNHRGADRTAQDEVMGRLAKLATAVSGLPALRGNRLELLENPAVMLDALIRDIHAARSHCHLLFYIWMCGGKADEVVEAVIAAAKRGVVCRVLVDAVGSKAFLRTDRARAMREAGVRLAAAVPANPLRMLFHRIDLRNHRKIAVIDGVVAYTGSQNITDATFKVNRRLGVGPWIDASVRLEGPAAEALQTVFLSDWIMDSGEDVGAIGQFLPDPAEAGTSTVHVVPSGPGPEPDAIRQAMLAMFFAAREEIVITTPYFVPDEATKTALTNAVLRGVSVALIVPKVLDAPIVAAAARAHFEDLLEGGVKVQRHGPGLLHAKTLTIDRRLAVIGTANFDMRSFWLNFESTLFVYDAVFAEELRALQGRYIASSEGIELAAWRARPATRRFVDNIAQLLGPLL